VIRGGNRLYYDSLGCCIDDNIKMYYNDLHWYKNSFDKFIWLLD
jgi:hypothetical protein